MAGSHTYLRDIDCPLEDPMAHTITRRWATIATVATALLVLTACGKSDGGDNPGPTPGGDGAFGGAPSGSATATPTTTSTDTNGGGGSGNGGGGGSGGGGGQSDPYPKDAKAYQLAYLNAFSAGDQNRLAALGNADQTLQATNSI